MNGETYTRVPNAVFQAMPEMSDAELRVTLALVRLIAGYHKTEPEPVSYSRLEQLTGMTRHAVIAGIRQALQRGLIQRAGRGARGIHCYVLVGASTATGAPDAPVEELTSVHSAPVGSPTSARSTPDDAQTSAPSAPVNNTTSAPSAPDLVHVVHSQNKKKEKELPELSDDSSGRPAPQPHIALIDAYLSALAAVGRRPIEANPYTRRVRIASAMVKAGVTAEQIHRFIAHVYDPGNPDGFWRERSKPIPLETVAEQLPGWLARQQATPSPSRNGGAPSADAALWSHILSSIPPEEPNDE